MKYLIPCFFAACLVFPNTSNGQILRAAEKAIKKAEQRVTEAAAEKTFNAVVDKLFGSDSTSVENTKMDSTQVDSTSNRKSNSSIGIFGSKTIDKTYDFDMTLAMVVTTEDEKGEKTDLDYNSLYSNDGFYIGSELDEVLNIMDFDDMKNYALVGGKLTVMDLQKIIDKANRMDKNASQDSLQSLEFKETGKTEVIAGYKCVEYQFEDENTRGSYWLTKDLEIAPGLWSKGFEANPNVNMPSEIKGAVLKMDFFDKENKSKVLMLTKSVKKEERSYNLSKYKATDLSRFKF